MLLTKQTLSLDIVVSFQQQQGEGVKGEVGIRKCVEWSHAVLLSYLMHTYTEYVVYGREEMAGVSAIKNGLMYGFRGIRARV